MTGDVGDGGPGGSEGGVGGKVGGNGRGGKVGGGKGGGGKVGGDADNGAAGGGNLGGSGEDGGANGECGHNNGNGWFKTALPNHNPATNATDNPATSATSDAMHLQGVHSLPPLLLAAIGVSTCEAGISTVLDSLRPRVSKPPDGRPSSITLSSGSSPLPSSCGSP